MSFLKLVFFLSFIAILSHSRIYAQNENLHLYKFNCDVYYGVPFLYTSVLKATYPYTTGKYDIHSTNHLGGKFEVSIKENFGAGIECSYAKSTINYIDSTSNKQSAWVSKLRVLGKFYYHFHRTEFLDSFVTFGIGYTSLKYWQSKSGVNNLSTNEFVQGMLPIALHGGIGMRYFFTKYFGVNAEIGLGGPLVQAGLTLRVKSN